jgi:hypothetical protein
VHVAAAGVEDVKKIMKPVQIKEFVAVKSLKFQVGVVKALATAVGGILPVIESDLDHVVVPGFVFGGGRGRKSQKNN